ncbi:TPA: hypothetical protein ACU6GO_005765 [Pseudomonas aeruginosa]|uniref:hypothetical protein n=1 Tax=Pseudomonas aeruginosa TaxID=287 RepID=UPI000FC40226|nr:hypothetical protein [Pseudomonas aeruginosa]RUI12044.1 hypothetical protein IPC443_32350 [Pseudomonas aeruginosa]HBO4520298.1 hypothetical protein [Pseudomonas aeruginosa]HBO6310298.1 hypothetical protein [Pseudomonas aeruginosa]
MTIPDHLIRDAAMRSAYTVLVRRLALEHGLDLWGLASDLDQMAAAQPDQLWQAQHRELAELLRNTALRVPVNDD